MKKIITTTVLLLSAFLMQKAICQNYITIGTSKYLSTPAWAFYDNASVCIGKRDGGGIIMLTKKETGGECYITGNIYIYLDDVSIIKCTDKGIRNNINGNAVSIYHLTNQEIQSLKKSDIKSITFSVTFYGTTNNYNIENKFVSSPSTNNYSTDENGLSINMTSIDIAELFN